LSISECFQTNTLENPTKLISATNHFSQRARQRQDKNEELSKVVVQSFYGKTLELSASFGRLAGLSLAGQLTHRNTVYVQIEQYFFLTTINQNSILAYFLVLPDSSAVFPA